MKTFLITCKILKYYRVFNTNRLSITLVDPQILNIFIKLDIFK